MSHHHTEKKEDITKLYYLVGILSGLFIGAVLDFSLTFIVTGGIVGLLFTTLFLNVLVKGRADS